MTCIKAEETSAAAWTEMATAISCATFKSAKTAFIVWTLWENVPIWKVSLFFHIRSNKGQSFLRLLVRKWATNNACWRENRRSGNPWSELQVVLIGSKMEPALMRNYCFNLDSPTFYPSNIFFTQVGVWHVFLQTWLHVFDIVLNFSSLFHWCSTSLTETLHNVSGGEALDYE